MSNFRVEEYTSPCQHVREYHGATLRGDDTTLSLKIKRYVPLDGAPSETPRTGTTIIAAAANAISKEAYEPIWEVLFARLKAAGVAVNSLWMADPVNQGASGVANEDLLGDDPHYWDYSRDLLHMVNTFRDKITRPIVGIGHSLGGCYIIHLSHMHPRLLHSVVLIEPIAFSWGAPPQRYPIIKLALLQRDQWSSREEAVAAFKKNPVYRSWDPRAFDKLITHALRDTPTPLFPDAGKVTLTTTRHQDAFSLHRPNFAGFSAATPSTPPDALERLTHPDVGASSPACTTPFYRPEVRAAFEMLPTLRPSCFFMHGEKSDQCAAPVRAEKMRVTGTGVGGSGGVAAGRVKEVVGAGGHFFPFEKIDWTAGEVAAWVAAETGRWADEEAKLRALIEKKTARERVTADKQWHDIVKAFAAPKAPMEELKAKM